MDGDSPAAGAVTHRFLRGLGIGGLAAIASLGFADRVKREQYNLLGGLGYMFGRPYYQTRYYWGFYQWRGGPEVRAIPEPSTIGFLGLGALVVLVSKKYSKERKR